MKHIKYARRRNVGFGGKSDVYVYEYNAYDAYEIFSNLHYTVYKLQWTDTRMDNYKWWCICSIYDRCGVTWMRNILDTRFVYNYTVFKLVDTNIDRYLYKKINYGLIYL